MDNNEYKNLEDAINNLEFELGDIMSKLKAKMDDLEQAEIELHKASDQLDAELGFWDSIPKKKREEIWH